MLRRLLSQIDRMAADRPVLLAFLMFLTATFIVVPLSIPIYDQEPASFFDNFLVEAHGFLFDLLIIGWFAVWLNKRAERRLRIRRYQEEIEDFLGWESQEAMHRITGDVRRLNREGITAMNLRQAFLQGAYLVEIDLKGSVMTGATLSSARLERARMAGVDLEKAQFELVNAISADLSRTNLHRANLTGAYLENTNLAGANLDRANLTGAFLKHTNLRDANLEHANFNSAYLEEADLRGATLTARQLEQAKTLYGTRFDPDLEITLKDTHPHLFERKDVPAN